MENLAREYLGRIRLMDIRIELRLERAERLRERAMRIRSARPRNAVGNGMDAVDRLIDLEREICRDVETLVDRKREAGLLLRRIGCPAGAVILEMRYLDGMDWRGIAMRASYSVRQAQRLHNEALRELGALIAG